jgi:hypothetical protein
MDDLWRMVGFTRKKAPSFFEIDIDTYKVRISKEQPTLQCGGILHPFHVVMRHDKYGLHTPKKQLPALECIYEDLCRIYDDALLSKKDTLMNDLRLTCKMDVASERNKDGDQFKLTIHFQDEIVYLYFDNSTGIKYTPITETIDCREFSFSRRQITTSGWSLYYGNLSKYNSDMESAYEKSIDLNLIMDEIYFACHDKTEEFKSRTVLSKNVKVVEEIDLFLTFIVRMQDGTTYKIIVGFLERGDSTDKFNNIRDWMDRSDPLKRKWRFDVTTNSEITRGFGRISKQKYEYRFEIRYIDAFPVNLYRFHFINEADLNQLKRLRMEYRDSDNQDIHPQTLVDIFDLYFQ